LASLQQFRRAKETADVVGSVLCGHLVLPVKRRLGGGTT
jgi:hypothetical protein